MTGAASPPPGRAAARLGRVPLSIGQVVEATVGLLAGGWRTALLVAALFVIPGALATVAFGKRFDEVALRIMPSLPESILEGSPVLTRADAEQLLGALVAYLGATVVAGLLGSVGAVALSRLPADDLRIGAGDLGDCLRAAVRRSLSVLAFAGITSAIVVALALAALVVVALLLTLQPGSRGGPGVFGALVVGVALALAVVYLTLRWAPAYAVMALEDAGWRRALARSWELSAEHIWRILVVVVMGTLVSLVIAAVASQLLAIIVVDALAPSLGLDPAVAESVVVVAGAVVAAPITPLLVAVLTIDLRVRHHEVAPLGPASDESGSQPDG